MPCSRTQHGDLDQNDNDQISGEQSGSQDQWSSGLILSSNRLWLLANEALTSKITMAIANVCFRHSNFVTRVTYLSCSTRAPKGGICSPSMALENMEGTAVVLHSISRGSNILT